MTSPTSPAGPLYELLPATYRIRDEQLSAPLRRLLAIIEEQLGLVESDLDRLYNNWFIETCDEWVVPYIGDLVGFHAVGPAALLSDPRPDARSRLPTVLFPRAAVANTVRSRRRKGTLALLKELAADVAGWPARAVEFYRLLGVTQPVRLLGTVDAVPAAWSTRGQSLDLRAGDVLDLVDGPFDTVSHTGDIRRPASHRTRGRHNIPTVGVFAWRLRSYPVTRSLALNLEEEDPHRYTFSILGNDAPLFIRPRRPAAPTEIATELDVPARIRRRALERHPDEYLGADPSLAISIGRPPVALPAERIIAADLKDWRYRPRRGDVAVDPERGRLLFAHDLLPDIRKAVTVSYCYGFSDDMGGGEYDRASPAHPEAEVRRASGIDDLMEQLAPWLSEDQLESQPSHAVVEITDSGVYDVALRLWIGPDHSLQLRGATGSRPVLRLSDRTPGPDALRITGQTGASATLDGLWVLGNAVQVDGDLATFTIRHCTLVPGWGLGPDCEPRHPARPGLQLIDTRPDTCIVHSITGSIQVLLDEVQYDPLRLDVFDSILDATSPDRAAVSALGGGRAHTRTRFVRSTVIGTTTVQEIALAENSIFDGHIVAARHQVGCMRFCSVLPGVHTPRRYHCQPDLIDTAVDARLPPGERREQARIRERLRVRPLWNSTRYGTPDYCQLAVTCAPEITRGADDESEMGAFHDLHQPQRTDALQAALDEYTPAGIDAGVFFAS